MNLAIALGGTDLGRSGLGVYVRSTLPRLRARIEAEGGRVIAIGMRRDLDAYAPLLGDSERVVTRDVWASAAINALYHLAAVGPLAARAGADVLLMPAANRRATRISPVPTVAVVHDLAPLRVKGRYDPLRMAYGRYFIVGALRSADVLVAVSDATRRDLEAALGRPEGSVRMVPNGVEHERFASSGDDDPRVIAARAHLGLGRPYVLYLGRLEHPGKNHLRLLRAFHASPARQTHALVIAGADWGAQPLIEAEIAKLGLGDRVKLLGYVPDDAIPGMVAGADAVAMVGLYEGFGLPALEALAAGRPVLASRTGALPEVVGDLAALCDPLDEGSIAGALTRALGDELLRARTRVEGPARAAARSWDATAAGLLEACNVARSLR